MKLEDQVCSLELSKKLRELGVKQESAFYWVAPPSYLKKRKGVRWTLDQFPENWVKLGQLRDLPRADAIESYWGKGNSFTAFTVAELGDLLGRNVNDVSWHVAGWREWVDIGKEIFHKTEADARASRLIYLIEQGIVKP